MTMAKRNPSSGWDPVLIISQIISLQTLHYVTLALLVPPLLTLLGEPSSLEYEGGAANVGMP
jgi:protein SYS1